MTDGIERSTLASRLAIELPHELRFTIHHLSSHPTPCPALFSPLPNQDPDQTSCESHFLSVSIENNGSQLQVFALEVLVYTTSDLTTIFVSKADSTGYLHLLELPKGQPSPIRTVFWVFLSHLIESRQRPGIRLVLSLFARAQDQYLFPGSIKNSQKHVLDDRGLIRWWCKIIDQVLRKYPSESPVASTNTEEGKDAYRSRGYLKVPGCDLHETRAFFPEYARREHDNPRWVPEDPLRILGRSPYAPERCLIPRFPDDPKARFVIDLDDELPENQLQAQQSPVKPQHPGKWRSVQSMEQFWEMMAFRQECAAGRLVGFIWGVFTPSGLLEQPHVDGIKAFQSSIKNNNSSITLPIPLHSQSEETIYSPPFPLRFSKLTENPPSPPTSSQTQPQEDSQDVLPTSSGPRSPPNSSPIQPQEVSQDVQPTSLNSPFKLPDPPLGNILQTHPPSPPPTISLLTQPSTHHSLENCHSEIILPEPVYQKISALLLTLDYADKTSAATSTQTWINAVAKTAGFTDTNQPWGQVVVGRKPTSIESAIPDQPVLATSGSGALLLNASLVRKKKRTNGDGASLSAKGIDGVDGKVTALAKELVRKKAKII